MRYALPLSKAVTSRSVQHARSVLFHPPVNNRSGCSLSSLPLLFESFLYLPASRWNSDTAHQISNSHSARAFSHISHWTLLEDLWSKDSKYLCSRLYTYECSDSTLPMSLIDGVIVRNTGFVDWCAHNYVLLPRCLITPKSSSFISEGSFILPSSWASAKN